MRWLRRMLSGQRRPENFNFRRDISTVLDPRDIVVFVGPNNAGKSAALREIEDHIGQATAGKVIKSVKLQKVGTYEEVLALIEKRARKTPHPADNAHYQGFRIDIYRSHLKHEWESGLNQLRGLFCLRLPTDTRITGSDPATAIAIDQAPFHPTHLLFADDRIERRLSSYFRRAFKKDLILFRAGGNSLPFLVGDRVAPGEGEDRISFEYLKRLRAVTLPLQEQGDGMRSFATVILHLLTPDVPSIFIIDEPEAFLHPPQARLLGEFIAKERPPHSQLFIATHSPDVLQGLLGAAADHLRVIRIERDGSINRVKELDKERAKEIAGDPLMKFSAVMSGVFHHRVIIGKSDADCMFYSSILDLPGVRGEQQPDVLFVHGGGKDRMPALA